MFESMLRTTSTPPISQVAWAPIGPTPDEQRFGQAGPADTYGPPPRSPSLRSPGQAVASQSALVPGQPRVRVLTPWSSQQASGTSAYLLESAQDPATHHYRHGPLTRPLEGDTEAIVAHIWQSLESGWGLTQHESKILHNGHRLDFFDVTSKETLDIVKRGGRFDLDAIPPLMKAVVTLGADDQVRSLWVNPTVGNPFMAHYGPPGAPGPTAPPIHMTPEQQDAVFLQRAPMTTVLEAQRLFVTPNSAETRVDSLIMALLQHATGQYLTIQMSLVVEIRKALRAAFPDIDMNAILQFDDPETQWLIREIMLRFSPRGRQQNRPSTLERYLCRFPAACDQRLDCHAPGHAMAAEARRHAARAGSQYRTERR
jgi:hypothetical protein